MQSWFVLAIVLLPLLGAVLNLALLVIGHVRGSYPSRAVAATIGAGAVGLAFVATLVSLWQLGSLPEGQSLHHLLTRIGPAGGFSLDLGLVGDPLSLWFAFVVTGVGFLIHVYSAWYMAEDRSFHRFFIKLNYFIFAMSLLVMSDNFLGLLMGWANVGFASYSLIGFWFERPGPQAASIKAFVTNLIGEIGIMAGIWLIYKTFGTVGYDQVFAAVPGAVAAHPGALTAIGLLLLVGAAAKSAQLPLHVWLPDAMQGPTSVSALIHAATMVTAGVYLAARAYPIYQASPTALMAVAVVGAASALFGALVATSQNDIKRVLAYSTMSQIGYMMLGAGVGAYAASLFHFMTHAFFKALLFLVAGAIIHHLAGEQDIRRMGGLGKKMPFIYWTFLFGSLALAGIPPFAGFFSKDEILGEVLATGHPVLWAMGVAAAGLTAFYVARLFAITFAGQPYAAPKSGKKRGAAAHGSATAAAAVAQGTAVDARSAAIDAGHGVSSDAHSGHPPVHHGDPATMWLPLAILAGLSVIGGWMAIPGVTHLPANFLGEFFRHFAVSLEPGAGHEAAEAGVNWLAMGAVTVISLAGAAIGLWLYNPNGPRRQAAVDLTRRETGILSQAFYFDAIYDWIIVRPVQAIASFVGDVLDPKGIDGIIHGLAGLVAATGSWLRGLQSGFVRRYALSVMVGVVLLVIYFGWVI
ncbi:MAG: NADH-quinone oxidoreductase subunit L [Bacillota bacterium]